jgi:hypothetical protein
MRARRLAMMIRNRMKRAVRTDVGREAPMVITPRRLVRLLEQLARVVRGGVSQRSTRD